MVLLAQMKRLKVGLTPSVFFALGFNLFPLSSTNVDANKPFTLPVVSKAFQVLSDSSLRAAFDRDGGDPEARFGSGMRSGGGAGRFSYQAL